MISKFISGLLTVLHLSSPGYCQLISGPLSMGFPSTPLVNYWEWVVACSHYNLQSQNRYYCSHEGKIECHPGWQWDQCQGPMCAYLESPDTLCSVPICTAGCHPEHGYCIIPGECECHIGFQGSNCTHHVGNSWCKHGTVSGIGECECSPEYEGPFCDQPVCSKGCDKGQGECVHPDVCLCEVGYNGDSCTECVTYPGCQHGTCNKPWECICTQDFFGTLCNQTTDDWITIMWRSQSGKPKNFFSEKSLKDYTEGFGDAETEYWMGLKSLADQTRFDNVELMVHMKDDQGTIFKAIYSTFKIGSGPDYTLTVKFDSAKSNVSDELSFLNGNPFTVASCTSVSSNNTFEHGHEDTVEIGGWWFDNVTNNCHHDSNLNGINWNGDIEDEHKVGTGITWVNKNNDDTLNKDSGYSWPHAHMAIRHRQ